MLLLTIGCFTSSGPNDWASMLSVSKKDDKPKGTPKFDVLGPNLGDSQEVAVSPSELSRRIGDLLAAKRNTSAARVVQRHPEAVLEALRSELPALKPDVAALFAAVHDRHCSTAVASQNWTQLLARRQQAPADFQEYEAARLRFTGSLTKGQIDNALKQNLTAIAEKLGAPLLLIDAWQLTGSAQLLHDRPADAVAAFQQALAVAEQHSDYQSAYLLLLLSEAQRRSGNADASANSWRQAVTLAGRMAVATLPVLDPVLWERIGYLRPVESPWPQESISLLYFLDPLPDLETFENASLAGASAPPSGTLQTDSETVVWNSIGRWYLDRGHAQAALVSFKRAESASPGSDAALWLRLRQARALAHLDQTGPATALLVALAADKSSPVSRPALGILGSLRLKSGQLQQGLGLLRKSVEANDGVEWPERPEAEADLALAMLMMGDANNGLARLHEAQRRFEAAGNWESLVLALENEAGYLEHAKKRTESAALRARLRDLESQ